jgi:hypothetical protein
MLNLIPGKIYEFQFIIDDEYHSESYFNSYYVDIGDQSFSPIYLDISNKDFVSIEFKALVLENEKQKRNSKVFVSNLLIVGTSTIVQTTIEIPYYMLESKIEFEPYPREGP